MTATSTRTGPGAAAAPGPTGSAGVFLVGAERSGTTLLRLILNQHPMIAWQNEFEYAVDEIDEEGRWPETPRYCEFLATHRVFRAAGFAVDASLSYPQLVRGFLEQRRVRDGKPVVGATVHRHFDRLLTIWPRARFIHLVRDPRDVARSVIGMGWAGNVWTGTSRWLEAERLWDRLCRRVPPDRRHEVRFEGLIAEPAAVLGEICAFLGVPYDAEMLQYHTRSTYERPDPRLAYQWRTKLAPAEVRLVETRVGDLLTARGYEPSGLPPARVGPLRRSLLGAQDRFARARFRLGRQGVRLWAAETISRRLGIRSWHRRCLLRANEVQAAFLK